MFQEKQRASLGTNFSTELCSSKPYYIYIIVFYNCDLNYNVLQDADAIIQL